MSEQRRLRRRSAGAAAARKAAGGSGAMAGPRFRQVAFPYPPVTLISDEQIERIHNASLDILARIGMKILSAEARSIFRNAGAAVDEATQIVRFEPGFIDEMIATAPEAFTLIARNPAKSVRLGGRDAVFSSVGGPAFVEDLEKGRRAGTYAEMCDYLRLIQSLDILHQEGGGPFEALDIAQDRRHLHLHRAQITLTDKNWQPYGLGRVRARDGLEMAAISLGCDRDALAERSTTHGEVVFTSIVNTNSPLMLDVPMAEALIEMARHGQANVITPFTLAGAMAPITLAGALAQQNAEALAGIALTQCVRPGAPVVYGGFTSNVDMRTGSPAFGTPEYAQAAQITGQLARRYKVPFRSSNATAANCCDAQAAYESQMSIWSALTGQAHLLNHAAGWLGGGLTASFEKLILDAEMLQMMAHYLTPPSIDAANLAVDAVAEVGHGGHFFGTAHTLERYETAFYAPTLSNWDNYETWSENGSRDAARRAHDVWTSLLASYEQPPIDEAINDALDDYVARREAEIDRGVDAPSA